MYAEVRSDDALENLAKIICRPQVTPIVEIAQPGPIRDDFAAFHRSAGKHRDSTHAVVRFDLEWSPDAASPPVTQSTTVSFQ